MATRHGLLWFGALLSAAACGDRVEPSAPAAPGPDAHAEPSDGGASDAGVGDATLPGVDAESPPVDSAAGDASSDGGDAASDAAKGPFDGRPCSYADPSLSDADAGGATRVRVRIMAANLTNGNFSTYGAPGIRILQGLRPDVVLIQEFKYAGGGLRDLVDLAFGADFHFMSEVQSGGIPNGVISRYPILQSGEWDDPDVPDRDFAYAKIDIPGSIDLWAVSVHFKTANGAVQSAEAQRVVGQIQANVPPGDYLVIGGDLNVASEGEQALVDLAAVTVVGPKLPADQNGNTRTNAPRSRPYDWVLASRNLEDRRMAVRIGASAYCDGLVFDSRVYSPLSEVAPVDPSDSNSINMQHMPVVRDFFLGD